MLVYITPLELLQIRQAHSVREHSLKLRTTNELWHHKARIFMQTTPECGPFDASQGAFAEIVTVDQIAI